MLSNINTSSQVLQPHALFLINNLPAATTGSSDPAASPSGSLNTVKTPLVTEPNMVRGAAEEVVVATQGALTPSSTSQESVSGTVVGITPTSVRCELMVADSPMIVQLPRALFPDNAAYGTPITLEMVNTNGYRMPKISIREVDRSSLQELDDELDQLLATL